jgi:pimeloyl-ACP methyl ester carboxylesterase
MTPEAEAPPRPPAPAWFERAIATLGEDHEVEVEGCRVHYLSWGDRRAPGLLLVPGAGGHAHWFSHVAPLFADQFHVVAMDPSGSGDSGRRAQYSQDLVTAEIIAVCEDAGLFDAEGPPTVLGHSAGAQAVVRAALADGKRWLGVIAVDGIRYTQLAKDPAFKSLSGPRPPPRAPRVHADLAAAVASFRLTPSPLEPIEARYVIDHIARHSARPVDGGWASKFDTAATGAITLGLELKDRLKDVACRVAVLYGDNTHLADETAEAEISKASGGRAVVFTLPGTTHFPMIDSPLQFVAAIKGISLSWRVASGAGPD